MQPRHIIHLDMDAFYASIEILDAPSLKGKPVIVGGNSNRGVVSAASYEARKFGIHSALPIAKAKQLCPNGVFLPTRIDRYREISQQIMDVFKKYTPLIEPISLDEAFLDVTNSVRLFGPPETIATQIRHTIKQQIGLTVSAGVSTSKLIAKIASDLNKPDGLTIVSPGSEKEFLAPLAIHKLWGAGKKTVKVLELMGVRTIGDLSKIPIEILHKKLGNKHGTHLHLASHAIDQREIMPERETKSIGHEDTFDTDLLNLDIITERLLELTGRVAERTRRHNLVGRTVTIKAKYYDFSQVTRSTTLQEATNDNKAIYQEGLKLLAKTLAGKIAIRLLGIYISGLQPADTPTQRLLFTDEEEKKKRKKLNQAIDAINIRFKEDSGNRKIQPARLFGKTAPVLNIRATNEGPTSNNK